MKKYDRAIIKKWKMKRELLSREEAAPSQEVVLEESNPEAREEMSVPLQKAQTPAEEKQRDSSDNPKEAESASGAVFYDLRAIRAKRKKRKAALIGALFVFLGVVGAVTVVQKTAELVFYFTDNTRDKEMFEQLIRPVATFDPLPFESVDTASDTVLLQSCIWGTLMENKRSYDMDENGQLLVPASDLDVTAVRCLDLEAKLEHQTFGDIEMTFTYDESTQLYHVPTHGYLGMYTPKVEKIVKQNGYTVLTVEYMIPGNAWNFNEEGVLEETEGVAKTRYYVMLQNKSGYYITAILSSDPLQPEDASSQTVG